MLVLFRRKEGVRSDEIPVMNKMMFRIDAKLRSLALFLQHKTSAAPMVAKRAALGLFLSLSVAICTYIVVRTLKKSNKISYIMPRIATPKYSTKTGDEHVTLQSITKERRLKTLRQKAASDVLTPLARDSIYLKEIGKLRPSLVDSLRLIEQLFKQQSNTSWKRKQSY